MAAGRCISSADVCLGHADLFSPIHPRQSRRINTNCFVLPHSSVTCNHTVTHSCIHTHSRTGTFIRPHAHAFPRSYKHYARTRVQTSTCCAAFLGPGWVSVSLTLPFEAVATRVNTSRPPLAVGNAVRLLWQEGGYRNFWRGCRPSLPSPLPPLPPPSPPLLDG